MSVERSRFRLRNNRGSILVVALWVIAILEIFTLSAGTQVRQKISLAERLDRRGWLYGVAEAGIYQMFMKIREEKADEFDSLKDYWSSNQEMFQEVKVDGDASYTVAYEYSDDQESDKEKKIRYGAQDEERKINLNTVRVEILSRFFEVVGEMDESDAKTVAYSVVDWRDTDSFLSDSIYGAEDDYYDSLKLPYEAKDAPFEVIQELLLVRGINMEIFDRVRDFITVYGTGMLNINTMPKEVLIAVGLTEESADNIITYRKGRDGEEGTEDDLYFASVGSIGVAAGGSGDLSPLTNLISAGLLTTASDNFMIRSRGEGKATALEITAVVNREGKILNWLAGKPQRIPKVLS